MDLDNLGSPDKPSVSDFGGSGEVVVDSLPEIHLNLVAVLRLPISTPHQSQKDRLCWCLTNSISSDHFHGLWGDTAFG